MGGHTSKSKDSDARKVPRPAVPRPHTPPEIPIDSPKAQGTLSQEKNDGDENKETNLEGAKPVTKQVEAAEDAEEPTKEGKEATETAVPKEVAETVVTAEEKEIATEAPKEEKKGAAEEVGVPRDEKKEPKEEKKEVVIEEAAVQEEKKKEDVAENVLPKQETT